MFREIEGGWPRREHFLHYMNTVRCTYSLTVKIDISKLRAALKDRGVKAYPVQIFMLASVVNRMHEFRMGISEQGDPGYWEILHPSYTVFNINTKTFSSIWTPFCEDFQVFYAACMEDINQYSQSAAFSPKKGEPPNIFTVSSVPWIDFTAFNLNVYGEGAYLAPIFTIGKYVEENNKILLPLAMQLHHAACDGYHAGRFIEALQEMALDCNSWFFIDR